MRRSPLRWPVYSAVRALPLWLALSMGLMAQAGAARAYADNALGDPMRPAWGIALGPLRARAELPRLDGIVDRAGHRLAIIDGRVLHEGDHSGAARIDHIGPDAVVCSLGDKTVLLRLNKMSSALQAGWLTVKDKP